jgi:hypothetical protein
MSYDAKYLKDLRTAGFYAAADELEQQNRHHASMILAVKQREEANAYGDAEANRADEAEQLVREARGVLLRVQIYAPDVGVDEFLDAIHDARLLIAKIDGAE